MILVQGTKKKIEEEEEKKNLVTENKKSKLWALAGVAQWIKHQKLNTRNTTVGGGRPKGHQLDSQPRHTPGLQARSPTRGMQEATTHQCFSLSPSLPL